MSDKQETIADIIAEMRGRKEMLVNAISSAPLCYPVDDMKAKVEILDEFIDRIEDAMKREKNAKKDIIITANGDALMNAYNALDEADGIIRRSMNKIKSIANISIKNERR